MYVSFSEIVDPPPSCCHASSLWEWANRQALPCLQRPLLAKRHILVLKNADVVRSSRSLWAKLQFGVSQVPVWRNLRHMLVHCKSGLSRISVTLCANWHFSPLRHLLAIKNLHISVFLSWPTCFCRSSVFGISTSIMFMSQLVNSPPQGF